MTDPAASSNQFNLAEGRWVLVDWMVQNVGTSNINVSAFDLKLLTADNFEIQPGNHAGHREPQIGYFITLGPGQTVRGYTVYDVPRGTALKAAIYHPSSSPQFIVAELP